MRINPNALFPQGPEGLKRPQSSSPSGKSFQAVLKDQVSKVNQYQKVADQSISDFAVGETTDTASVVVDIRKAESSLKMMVAVRNKLLDAYREVLKTSV